MPDRNRSKYFPRSDRELETVISITEHREDYDVVWTKKDPAVGRWFPVGIPRPPGFYLSTGQLMNRFLWRGDATLDGNGDTYSTTTNEETTS